MPDTRLRSVATVAVALFLAAEIAQLTVASAEAEKNPALSARLAGEIPPVLVSSAMGQVGRAAAEGTNPGPETIAILQRVAEQAPLQPEPLLVEAAVAEREGRLEEAAQLLIAARWRNPRSIAARYLLADVRMRQGRIADGLGELAIFTQILPDSNVQLVPALASYAKEPGAEANLARIIEINPRLKRPLLLSLAADPSNADMIVALSHASPSTTDGAKAWQERLLNGFIARGDYDRAYSVWQRFAGAAGNNRPLIFNADFRRTDAPPPFNWTYSSTAAGFAEPEGGSLRVLYYGRAPAALAGQLLLLSPGSYAFTSPAGGAIPAGTLEWSIRCQATGAVVMHSPPGAGSSQFTVPANCPAQRIILSGNPQETDSDIDVRLAPVRIQATGR